MTSVAHDWPRRPRGFQAVAVVALASLACTTVRVPASGIAPSVKVRGDAAEPQLELWVESSADVSPAEASRAVAEARAALEGALAARQLAEGEQLLVVRAQGVSRTGSRRTDQKAAIAGIAVAAVAIVAVVVVALVATKGKGGGGKVPNVFPTSASPPAVRVPAAVAVPVRPPPIPIPRPAPPPVPASVATAWPRPAPPPVPARAAAWPRPSGSPGHGGVAVGVGFDVQIGAPVGPDAPTVAAQPPGLDASLVSWEDPAVAELVAPPPPPLAVEEVVLPPPAPLDVSRRGFFAGDSTRLELTLVERATGRPLWVKTVESGEDPRNARAVRALLDRALGDPSGWEALP